MYFNLISIFELKIARPSLECSFKVQQWSLTDDDPNSQLFTRVELFMRSCIVTVADLVCVRLLNNCNRAVSSPHLYLFPSGEFHLIFKRVGDGRLDKRFRPREDSITPSTLHFCLFLHRVRRPDEITAEKGG